MGAIRQIPNRKTCVFPHIQQAHVSHMYNVTRSKQSKHATQTGLSVQTEKSAIHQSYRSWHHEKKKEATKHKYTLPKTTTSTAEAIHQQHQLRTNNKSDLKQTISRNAIFVTLKYNLFPIASSPGIIIHSKTFSHCCWSWPSSMSSLSHTHTHTLPGEKRSVILTG